MNILVTLNSGYVLPLCTMLKSLSYSNEGTDIDLYIVHSSLTLADFIENQCSNNKYGYFASPDKG